MNMSIQMRLDQMCRQQMPFLRLLALSETALAFPSLLAPAR